MARTGEYQEGGVWLDLAGERLWRGTTALRLRRTSFAVLRYLIAHPGRVVSKDELLEAVWPETAVSEGVLTVCINELRTALGDPAQAPRYIETVHRRGYRWLGTLPLTAAAAGAPSPPPASPLPAPAAAPHPPPAVHSPLLVVGREAAGAELQAWLAQARQGVRQVGFVTGEAGLGKTTVVDTFVAQVAQAPDLWLARGQCIEHYGTGEAYLPVLDALGQLGRGPDGAQVVAGLAQYAPTWLVQMPALLAADALEAVQRRVLGATRERMLRELTEALEALTTTQTLVLVLEDLHWSDAATLDLLGALARQRAPARLLVLGTYRPVEVIVRARPLHALKLDLMLHRQCWELPLQLLTAADVAQYLARRFGAGVCPEALALALHRRTDGHPLFLVTVVDALVQQGLLREVAGHWQVPADLAAVEAVVPESVQQMIAQQFDALPAADRDVLEAASVAGLAHTVAVVAAGVEATDETVEARCTSLAQRGQFVQAHGVEEWPDGTVTGRYGFRHTLYQQVVYEQVPVGRRLRLHRQIGARLEAGYGAQAGERAAELARHFAAGRDHARAVTYLQQAAANALRRWAYAEALGHLQRAVALLPTLPDTPARRQQELAVYLTLGQTWIATKGAAAAEVEAAYTRAQELCAQVGELPQHFDVLRGLSRHYLMRAAYRKVQTLGAQRLRLAERRQDPELLTEAHASLGVAAYYLGELATAQAHFMQGLGVYDIQQHAPVPHYAQDSRGICLNVGAQTCWVLGYPDQALALQHQALAHARVLAHPFGLGMALGFAASLHLLRGEWSASQAHAEASRRLALEHDLGMMATQGMLVQGVALAAQGHHEAGLAQMRQAMAAIQAAGQEAGRLLAVAVLAEQYGLAGQVEAGLHVLSEALASLKPQEPRLWEPELHRVRGTLLLQAGGVTLDVRCQATEAEAETCFQQALALAQRQGARAFELRAATGLSRLWQRQGKHAEARALLAPLYGWFTEGFDTADLRAAKALLDELGA